MPNAFQTAADWASNPTYSGNFPASTSNNLIASLQQTSGPAYDKTTSIPSWLPAPDTSKLESQYADTGKAYDTNPFDTASQNQQSRVLSTALNAGNNAATEYANKARQAGGSGMGAGLVKAEASVGARASAGEMEMKRQQFDADMRDKAATHATAIATTLAGLRQNYLQTIVDYSTKEDQIGVSKANVALDAAKLEEQKRQFNWTRPTGGGYLSGPTGQIGSVYGTPFRDPNSGMPTSDPRTAALNSPPANNFLWGGVGG